MQSPEEISNDFTKVMRQATDIDYCSFLIGSALLFHSGKVNSKLPGAQTPVMFYQDFLFPPMSNGDMFTCLISIAGVPEDKGPLEVVPGTHKGPLYSL